MNKEQEFNRYVSRGDYLFDQHEYEQALLKYKRALKLKPMDKELNQKYIKTLTMLEKLSKAETEVRILLKESERDNDLTLKLKFELGDLLIEQKKYKEAKEHFRKENKINSVFQSYCEN